MVKMKKLLLRIITIIILLTGCSSSTSANPTSSPTYANADVPTQTEAPSPAYPTPTIYINNRITTVTSTSKAIPTLTSEEREIVTLQLLSTNGGCSLPCWWGFILGDTKWEQVNNFLVEKGAKFSKKEVKVNEVIYETASFNLEDNSILHKLYFLVNNGIVKSIFISGDGIQNTTLFKKVWKEYFPDAVIRNLGEPSQLLLSIPNGPFEEPANYVNYDMWIIYESLGISFKYTGSIKNEANILICPFSNNGVSLPWSISILLGGQNNSQDLMNSLQYFGYSPVYLGNLTTLESVSGVNLQELNNLLIEDQNKACFPIARSK
jgi:hypothetical protein